MRVSPPVYRSVPLIAFLLIICSRVAGAYTEDSTRGGPPFSDPGTRVEMDETWRNKPIVRTEWAEGADLAVTVDQHLYPAILPLIREFAMRRHLRVEVHEGTCGISTGLLIGKQVDVGGFCCPVGMNDRLPGLNFHTIGIAGLAIIVHPDNPVNNLDLERVRDIFHGKIRTWDEVDGALEKHPIRVIGRLHCKQRPGHWRLLLDNEDLFSPEMIEVGTIKDMMDRVARDRWAIGYEVMWNIVHYGPEAKVKHLKINNADPASLEDVASLRYPLYRVYNITTWAGDDKKASPALDLIHHIIASSEKIEPIYSIVPVSLLRQNGWMFNNDELIGEPNR